MFSVVNLFEFCAYAFLHFLWAWGGVGGVSGVASFITIDEHLQ